MLIDYLTSTGCKAFKELQKLLVKSDRIFWAAKAISQDPKLWEDPETQGTLKHIASMFQVHPQLQSFKFEKSWDWETGVEKFKGRESELLKLHRSRLVEKKGKKFIDLGGGWAWWDLKAGGCEKEGKALDHCGNVHSKYRGDTLLSLRKEVGNQYEPFLTFVLNKGVLGEMKARGNEKPRKKYHKYITKLLEDPRIVHIWGGGYEPHRNFHFEDLTPEEQVHLLKLKPDLVFDHLDKIPSNHKLPEKHMREVDDHKTSWS